MKDEAVERRIAEKTLYLIKDIHGKEFVSTPKLNLIFTEHGNFRIILEYLFQFFDFLDVKDELFLAAQNKTLN